MLLERFIDENHDVLEEGAYPELESLLRSEDDVLWDWLQQPDRKEASPYRNVLSQLRRGA